MIVNRVQVNILILENNCIDSWAIVN